MDPNRRDSPPIPARLGLWDATSLVVGIIIGVGIFETPALIFEQIPNVGIALAIWLIGGLLALIGAFCFAELASTYPHSGGEYVYLTRAFGSLIGFLFAWIQLTLIRPASIGAMAYIFAKNTANLIGGDNATLLFLAVGAVVTLTLINVIGVTLGKYTQNVLTVLKTVGLAGIIAIGLWWGRTDHLRSTGELAQDWFASGMIFALWTYAGWHEAAYIAAEVRDNRRNLPLSLIFGTLLTTGLYLLVVLAISLALGVDGGQSKAFAANLVSLAWPGWGPKLMSLLIVVSALGALNGSIFTTARIGYAFSMDHPLFAPLGRWSRTWNTPARALLVEGAVTIALVVGVYFFGSALNRDPLSNETPFADLVLVTAAVFWSIFLLTGIALFVLRIREPEKERPFRVPLYPVLPLAFCACCAYMIYGAIDYKPLHSLVGFGIVLAGLPFYFLPGLPRKLGKLRPVKPAQPMEHVG